MDILNGMVSRHTNYTKGEVIHIYLVLINTITHLGRHLNQSIVAKIRDLTHVHYPVFHMA